MYIVVDESLGLPKNLLTEVQIRPTSLKKDISLSDAIAKAKKGWGMRKLPLAIGSTEELLEEVHGWAMKDHEVLYIYDEHTINAEWVKRFQNWFYPNQHLYLVNGTVHRGLALHLLSNRNQIPALLESGQTGYVITSNSKYLEERFYLKMGTKKPKKYYLIKNRVMENSASSIGELVEEIMRKHPGERWLVTSNHDFQANEINGEYFKLEESAFPINSQNIYLYPLQQENFE
ncbi:hypothetical protein LCM10_18690 [Rossellomorea aquimaris]|uniref:hypothetical protein n=1 Tax=Rossellomorea aquimaris TaxID=189382 RepID=UPI001CD66BF8|nr:hypothetical protein [Rossellomorea aquimaris]MCA1056995.1 hypothetical protein [Rossellomorea aquimaris]